MFKKSVKISPEDLSAIVELVKLKQVKKEEVIVEPEVEEVKLTLSQEQIQDIANTITNSIPNLFTDKSKTDSKLGSKTDGEKTNNYKPGSMSIVSGIEDK